MGKKTAKMAPKTIEIMNEKDVDRILSFLKDKMGPPRGLNHAYLWEIASSNVMRIFYTESEKINNVFYGYYVKTGIVIEDWYSDGFFYIESIFDLIDLHPEGEILFAFEKKELGNKFGWKLLDEVREMVCSVDKYKYVDSCPFFDLHYGEDVRVLLSQQWWTDAQVTNLVEVTSSNPYGFSKIILGDNGHAVGFCHTMYDKGSAWISCVYVDKNSRRKGYAQRLVESVLAGLKERGITKVFLGVDKSNTNAIELYKELGFEFTDFRKWQFEVAKTLPRR